MRANRFWALAVGALAIARILAACGGDDTNGGDVTDAGNDGSISSQDAATDAPASDGAGDAGPPPCLVDASGPYIADAIEVSLGADFGCALRQDGTVACWGDNESDNVAFADAGSEIFHGVTIPFPASAGRMKHISVGSLSGYAISETGNVWAWGDNFFGELGQPALLNVDGGDHPIPEIVNDSLGNPLVVRDLHAGFFSVCAITTDNRLLCWGRNDANQLGVDAGPAHASAVPLPGPTLTFPVSEATLTSIGGTGGFFVCATSSSAINCWGRNAEGELALTAGAPGFNGGVGAALVDSGATFPMLEVSNGLEHACVIDSAKKVWCWGQNSDDQIGPNASAGAVSVPTAVPLPEAGAAIDLGLGQENTCVLAQNGKAYCFGSGAELGNGFDAGTKVSTPQLVIGIDGGNLDPIARLAGGGGPNCATLVSTCGATGPGPVVCWGYGAAGDLGNTITGSYSYTPVPVLAPTP